jgi:DNA recombination protein RmuC
MQTTAMSIWGWGWMLALAAIVGGAAIWVSRRYLWVQLVDRDTRLQAQNAQISELSAQAARLPDAMERSRQAEASVNELNRAGQDAAAREATLTARLNELLDQRTRLQSVVEEQEHRRDTLQSRLDEQHAGLAASQAALGAAENLVKRLTGERDTALENLAAAREQIIATSAAMAKASAERDAANSARDETKQFLLDAQSQLRTAFIEVASTVFDDKALVLDQRIQASGEASKQGLETVLKPFSEHVTQFQSRIEQINTEHSRDRAMLAGTIGELKSLNQNMADAAFALTKALKGNAKARGDWGELVLETVLKASGLEEGRNYTSQASAHDAETGQRCKPDVVVNLPDGRQVVIDSKVNLVAWADANSAETTEAQQDALSRHVAALRAHVRDLADKNYPRAIGPDALDMTVLFMPIEGALSTALQLEPDLQTEAFALRVVFASPNTLMAMLRVIERLWTRDSLQKQVDVIGVEAGKLLDAVSRFMEDFKEIDTRIQQTGEAFSAAKNRLVDSPQSVTARARRLVEAGARGRRALPAELQTAAADTSPGVLRGIEKCD